jgi:hypothetical protein
MRCGSWYHKYYEEKRRITRKSSVYENSGLAKQVINLFALAFYIAARNLTAGKVKDYLSISAIGIIMVRIALSISALEPTYGVAAHSTVLLSSYLFIIGFSRCFCSRISK